MAGRSRICVGSVARVEGGGKGKWQMYGGATALTCKTLRSVLYFKPLQKPLPMTANLRSGFCFEHCMRLLACIVALPPHSSGKAPPGHHLAEWCGE